MIVEDYSRRPAIVEFNNIFDKCLSQDRTHEQAYEFAEKYWKHKYDKRKYKNFQSFRQSRRFYLTQAKKVKMPV